MKKYMQMDSLEEMGKFLDNLPRLSEEETKS